MNKTKIMLTVDPNELLSKNGIKQTLTVATDQVGAYSKNPSFAIKQAAELYSYQNEIKLMIVKYAIGHMVPVDTSSKAVFSTFRV